MNDKKFTPSKKVDWEACERDFRTGKFTLRELEAKHNVSYAQIGRRAKKDGWVKDLRDVIKAATDAALLHESVTKAQRSVTEAIDVAVETNLRVIRGQHSRLDVMQDLFIAGAKVAKKLLSEDGDAKEAQAGVQAMATALGAGKMLTELERKVHKLDDSEPEANSDEGLYLKIIRAKQGQ